MQRLKSLLRDGKELAEAVMDQRWWEVLFSTPFP